MPKYVVKGSYTLDFDFRIEVEAENPEDATEQIAEMDYDEWLENQIGLSRGGMEIDAIELKKEE